MGVENIDCKDCTRFKVVTTSVSQEIPDARLKKGFRLKIVDVKTYKCEAYGTELKADQHYGYCPVGQLSSSILADKQ